MSQRDEVADVKIVNTISPALRDAWEVVLQSDSLALETQSPAWADATCATGGFEDACKAGCRYYYMGDSGWSVSLAQFKERFVVTFGVSTNEHSYTILERRRYHAEGP